MRRIVIRVDDEMYARLKVRATNEKRSMASIVRESLEKSYPARKLTMADFTFIGSGRSKQGKLAPVSENHDEALAEAIMSRWQRRK